MSQTSVLWSELRAPELRTLAKPTTPVIIPIGSIEQHGPHLPSATDSILASEVAKRAAGLVAAQQPILVTECVWSGLSEHHMALGATLTLDFTAFLQVIGGVVRSLKRHGFSKVLLLNGHGGNVAALQTVVEQLTLEHHMALVSATYWQLASHKLGPLLERQTGIRHACEAETAMMLAIRPDLVDTSDLEAAGCPDARDQQPGHDDGYRWQSFADKTPTGALGEPAAATAQKGEKLLEVAASHLAERLVDESFWGLSA